MLLARCCSRASSVTGRVARQAVPRVRSTGAQLRRGLATDSARRVVRFVAVDGEEHFGEFTDVTEGSAYIYKRGADGRLAKTAETRSVHAVLAPVDPPAIYCVGLNYADHAAEVKMPLPRYPVVFMKPATALVGHRSAIVLPRVASDPPEVDYEAELAVVIGKEAKNVSEAEATDYVLGYTIANDVTARRWQGKKGGGQWVRSKAFDTFLPLGPYLVPRADIPDPHALKIRTYINDDLVQDSNTSNMMVRIPALIAFLSQGTTLLPGTVILTGTPAGVGYVHNRWLQRGDEVRISIDGLGTLSNPVAQEEEFGISVDLK